MAYACLAIADDPLEAAALTSRANLVAVVSNGTAVLGLGQIGRSPRNRHGGQGLLFKKFANIDVFDIELSETDPDKIVEIVAALEPTFGGINLEDIKAPECFQVERKLRDRMKIPVFHDDQHGTAIIVAAAVLNGLRYVGKSIENVKLAGSGPVRPCSPASTCSSALASGAKTSRRQGGLRRAQGRDGPGQGAVRARHERPHARRHHAQRRRVPRPFAGGVVKPEMVKAMAEKPLILALANPEPEIRPEAVKQVRSDALIFTGRSDYPNQVNNVLCFPFIFRGALDVGATTINEPMKIAAVHAIADLAHAEVLVASAYGGQGLRFGPST